jgi:hypothetical protein
MFERRNLLSANLERDAVEVRRSHSRKTRVVASCGYLKMNTHLAHIKKGVLR